jgi:hypothetical protein
MEIVAEYEPAAKPVGLGITVSDVPVNPDTLLTSVPELLTRPSQVTLDVAV